MVESAREVCGSVRVGGGSPNSVWWNDEIKASVKRKETTGKEMLEARDEVAKERYLEVYKEEKRKVKRCIYQSKKNVQEQLEKKINQGVNGNRKLF